MIVAALPTRARWLAAAAGAIAVLVLLSPLFLLPRIPSLAPATARPPTPVQLADSGPANPVIREDMAMHDLAPLFLPTERNASLTRLPRLEVGRALLDLEMTKLSRTHAEMSFERDLPPAPLLNGKAVTAAAPADALTSPSSMPATGFGRATLPVEPLGGRGAYLEVASLGTGELLFTDVLDVAAKPAADKPWAPVQFMASVAPGGLVGPLILTERSGAEEIDQHFRNYLAQTYRIGQRLPPGIYRITVGP